MAPPLLSKATPPAEIYTLSLHDALPISTRRRYPGRRDPGQGAGGRPAQGRSEEHTSELQSQFHLVCRLLLEKKKFASPLMHPVAAFSPPPNNSAMTASDTALAIPPSVTR